MKHKALLTIVIFVLLLVVFSWTRHHTVADSPAIPTLSLEEIRRFAAQEATRADGNLLINGDMNTGFYLRPPNHYIAWPWFEWWGDYTAIPQFMDGANPYNHECYPPPPAGQSCIDAGNHSQGYVRLGSAYIAGIYQPVSGVIPCSLYTFEAYTRNDAAYYHPKVGIDVAGWIITQPGNSQPNNCPPNGATNCPDPYVAQFPSTTLWSAEGTQAAYTWGPVSVTAEAINTTVSVWTYVAPEIGGSMSTYWDYASLVQTPFPNGKLPAPSSWIPSGFIQNLTVEWLLDKVRISWTTPEPASTQVWYTFTPGSDNAYDQATAADTNPTTWHQVVIEELRNGGDTLRFAALSRRLVSGGCTTEVATQTYTVPDRTPTPASWAASPMIQNLSAAVTQSGIQVTWDTPISTTSQVWYTILPAPTPPHTSTMVLGNLIYLPFLARTSYNYMQYTPLSLELKMHHSALIAYTPKAGERIDFLALSGYTPDNVVTILVSEQRNLGPFQSQLLTSSTLPTRFKK